MPADTRTQAFVLSRTNYGEYDRIINVITEQGRRSLIARGVRKEKSKLAGGIELLSLSDITIHSGKSHLEILTSARLVEFYSKILEDYDRLQFAYETLKQISKASDHIDSPDFFDLTHQTLKALNENTHLPLVQTWFNLNLARTSGTDLNLLTDTNGMKLIEDGTYTYDSTDEAFKPSQSGKITSSHIKFLRLLVTSPLATATKVTNTNNLVLDLLPISRALIKH
ncbi:DNA repair protein RecO [Candidatus Saccharibacteria bacterium]|nr:DNA repair protein RecO [Candidatus Saccharibacteria bacterium]